MLQASYDFYLGSCCKACNRMGRWLRNMKNKYVPVEEGKDKE